MCTGRSGGLRRGQLRGQDPRDALLLVPADSTVPARRWSSRTLSRDAPFPQVHCPRSSGPRQQRGAGAHGGVLEGVGRDLAPAAAYLHRPCWDSHPAALHQWRYCRDVWNHNPGSAIAAFSCQLRPQRSPKREPAHGRTGKEHDSPHSSRQ